MKNKKMIATALIATLALGLLAGCGANGNKQEGSAAAEKSSDAKVIKIGASPSPHEEILNHFKEDFKKDGYTLEVVSFSDYVLPNKSLSDGEIDANYFQHLPYLEDFNKENKTELVSATPVHYEPMGIFSEKMKSLDAIKEGAKIAVPNDTSNEARALLLLQENGIIKLKEGAGINATVKDIAENPKKVEIVELEAAQIPRSLGDVDLAVVNGNYAIAAGLKIADALVVEAKDSLAAQTYANIIAVRKGEEASEKTKEIIKVLTSESAKKYIEENYKGAVLPV